jgi:hypothetical protein
MYKALSRRNGVRCLPMMAVAGVTCACMLAAGTPAPETAFAKDDPPVQPPILCEADQSALAETAGCLERFKGLAARDGEVLRLNLENGQTKVYTSDRKACQEDPNGEKCIVFRLAALYPSLQSFLVDAIFADCGHYELISRRSGSIVKISDATDPVQSPTGKYLVSVDQSDACRRPYDVAIWSTRSDPPVQEFKYEAKRYENWTVAGWAGDERIKFKVFVNDRDGSFDQDAEAVRSDKGWKLVPGRKVERATPAYVTSPSGR